MGLGCFAAINMPPSVLAMSFPHRGAQLGQLMKQYDHMMLAGLLCEDTATGRVRTIRGRPQAFYQLSAHDAANMQRGLALLAELLFAARRAADLVAVPPGARARLARRRTQAAHRHHPAVGLGGGDRAHDGDGEDGRRSHELGHR